MSGSVEEFLAFKARWENTDGLLPTPDRPPAGLVVCATAGPARVPVDPEVLRRLYLVAFEADLYLRTQYDRGLARERLRESVAAVWADLGAGR